MFKTYKETLNKNQLKQFEQIESNIKNIIITDDGYLSQLDTFIDKKIKTLKSEASKQFYLDAKEHIHSVSNKIKEHDTINDLNNYSDDLEKYNPPFIEEDDIAPLLNDDEDISIEWDRNATLYNLLNDHDKYILTKPEEEPTLEEKQDFLKAIMPCTGVVAPVTYVEIIDGQTYYVVADHTPQLETVLEYLDNKFPVNDVYFKDLDKDVQDVFLGSTYLEEERYTYEHNGEIENFPDRLKKEIFNIDILDAKKEVTEPVETETKPVQVDDDFVSALKELASDNLSL
jgi:hypothetical protein